MTWELTLETGGSLPFAVDGKRQRLRPAEHRADGGITYIMHVLRGVTLQPDFQYFFRPGATTNTRDAAALGFRTNINF